MVFFRKYNLTKKVITFTVACLSLYGVILGILQYHQGTVPHNLVGEWKLNLKINSTSYNTYQGMSVGYKLFLNQNGKVITGQGEKWLVNNKEIPFNQHSPISMDGTLNGNNLVLSFKLKGSKRETVGAFVLKVQNQNKLVGTFSTTGANSKGDVVFNKVTASST